MKKLPVSLPCLKKTGFTLVELLVVMGIIAILAAVTLQIGNTVINLAKRTKAQNTATQIQTAVLNYYTEYSIYPTPSGATASTDYELTDADGASGGYSGTKPWGSFIDCLSGNISPTGSTLGTTGFSTSNNTRSIAFLTLKATDVGNSSNGYDTDAPVNPLPASPLPSGTGVYFNMAIDTDYDNVLGVSGTSAVTNMPNFVTLTSKGAPGTGGSSTGGVAVWANCNQNGGTSANWYVHTY